MYWSAERATRLTDEVLQSFQLSDDEGASSPGFSASVDIQKYEETTYDIRMQRKGGISLRIKHISYDYRWKYLYRNLSPVEIHHRARYSS